LSRYHFATKNNATLTLSLKSKYNSLFKGEFFLINFFLPSDNYLTKTATNLDYFTIKSLCSPAFWLTV